MKSIAAVVTSVVLVAGGAFVGWELKQWHSLLRVWAEKVAAYDFVGPAVMERVMIEMEKQRILREREQQAQPVQAVPVKGEKLPAYPPMKRWERPA
jgi:hypothetical protein